MTHAAPTLAEGSQGKSDSKSWLTPCFFNGFFLGSTHGPVLNVSGLQQQRQFTIEGPTATATVHY